MSAYNTNVKQEMPPRGGYEEIHYKRIPAQRIIGCKFFFFFANSFIRIDILLFLDKSFFGASLMLSAYGFYYFRKRHYYMDRLEADWYDHVIAVEPLIRAESDRA